jgi:putative ABC transport system permease protein
MNRSLLKTSFRLLVRRPWQSGLMLLGIALGVAVVIAIDLANESSRQAFQLSAEALVGKASHQIRGGPSGIPEDLYRQIRVDDGIRASAPVVEGIAIAIDLDQQPLQILGVDPLAETPFRNYLLAAPIRLPGFERFYTDPSSVIVSEDLANRYRLEPGATMRIQVNDRLESVLIMAVLSPAEGELSAAIDNLLLMDLAAAQELTGTVGRLSRIDLILSEVDAAGLSTRLPTGVSLQPANQQISTVSQLTAAFELNLTALSLLAVVVGMFLIYNTMMFSVVQRRTALGTLRALGVSDFQVMGLILFEALLIGAVGSGLGLLIGSFLGRGAVQLVSQTINDLYFVVSVRETVFTSTMVVKGFAIGTGASVFAAFIPALEAASVPPVTVLRQSKFEEGFQDLIPQLRTLGILLVSISTALLLTLPEFLGVNFAALFIMIVGIALIVPWAITVLMKILSTPFGKGLGLRGRFAARRVVKSLSRTSVAIATLMISLSVTIGVSIMISSFRSTVENWLDVTLRADLYISAPTAGGTRPDGDLSPDLLKRLEHIQGIETIETFHAVTVDSPVGSVQLSVADGRRERDQSVYRFAQGTPSQVWEKVVEGAVIVSEPFAYRYDIPQEGGTVTLLTDQGYETFPVVGIYYDYSSDRGAVLMSDNIYRNYWQDRAISSIALYLEDRADLESVSSEVQDAFQDTGLLIQANRVIREQALEIFDRTFAITSALRVLTVLIAFIGVLSALLALLLERSREGATMQALGMVPKDFIGMTMLESGLLGSIAGVLSWPTGMIMAVILIFVINLRSFGWTIRMEVNPIIFGQAFIIGLFAALLAAIYPVYKLHQRPIAESLHGE